jgi:hypothetical protein
MGIIIVVCARPTFFAHRPELVMQRFPSEQVETVNELNSAVKAFR